MKCKQNNLFAEKLTVGWMKQQCYITSKNFASQFKYHVGKTPRQYITYHRMKVARQILAKNELRNILLSTVAYELGFSNPASFSRIFKRKTGLTPSEWREKENQF